jgi:allantoinase
MTYDSTREYPRDLAGHGRNVPHARWPNSARIAVQFVLNYEEGGENSVLHGDDASEPHQHGRHLRIRLARRRLAHPA